MKKYSCTLESPTVLHAYVNYTNLQFCFVWYVLGMKYFTYIMNNHVIALFVSDVAHPWLNSQNETEAHYLEGKEFVISIRGRYKIGIFIGFV